MAGYKLFLAVFLLCASRGFSQSDSSFVNILNINPSIQLDIRYATQNNFLGEKVYQKAQCIVRYAVAVKLDSVQQELETIGLGLKIFDGYRPLSVQRRMWEVMPDSRYVANPKNGSRHNRGAAVDLTLVDRNGNDLAMPTDFDDFSEKAHHGFMDLPHQVLINRWILRTIMEKYGFERLESEWWHYDLKGWQKFAIRDVSFQALEVD